MKKNNWPMIMLTSALLAVLMNFVSPLYLAAFLLGLILIYVIFEQTELVLALMMICIFLPFYTVIGGLHIATSDFIVFIYFVAWIFKSLMLRKKIFVPHFFVYLLVFLAALFLSMYSAINMNKALKEIAQLIQLTLTYIMVITNNVKSTGQIKNLLKLAVYSGFCIAALAIMYFLLGNVQGLYNLGFHKNALGSLMALSFPIALMNSRIYPGPTNFLIMLTIGGGLVVSLSRGAWLGALVGIILMEALYHHKHLLRNILVAVLCITFAFSVMPSAFKQSATSTHTLTLRQEQWNIAKAGFLRNPWTGIGYANFLELSKSMVRYQYYQHEDPHNIALRIASETGGIGLFCFGILFLGIYSYCWQIIKKEKDEQLRWFEIGLFASLIAYLIHGMFDVFWVRGTGSYFWIFVSLIVLLKENRIALKEDAK